MSVVAPTKGSVSRKQADTNSPLDQPTGAQHPWIQADWEVWPLEATWSALCHSKHPQTRGLICPRGDRSELVNDGSKNIIAFFSMKYRHPSNSPAY